VQGLITLEDILEEIVGQISDEHDGSETAIRLQADGTVNVDGSVPIRDLNRQMNWDLPDEEATTIAGLVIHEAQTIPEPGQTFTFHGYRFEILRKSRNKLTALRVTPVAEGMPGKLSAAGRAKDKAASSGGEADPMSSG
jgi:Mg2+/Co2+ transporter CorB